jgi:hypothetical protein
VHATIGKEVDFITLQRPVLNNPMLYRSQIRAVAVNGDYTMLAATGRDSGTCLIFEIETFRCRYVCKVCFLFYVVMLLSHLVHNIFSTGIFSDEFKTACVLQCQDVYLLMFAMFFLTYRMNKFNII